MQRSIALAFLCTSFYACAAGPFDLVREAAGSTSQTLCSGAFVSGLDPDTVFREQLRPEPGMALVDWALKYEVDRDRREVRTRIAGSFERRSVYRAGRGCTLVYEGYETPRALSVPAHAPETAAVSGEPALTRALDAAFAEPPEGDPRNTKAVVVMRGGRVIAERYAPGYDVNTPVNGHSLAKSLVNALVGVLVRQGKLSVTQPAPVAAWGRDVSRAPITIDQLLRMSAGFGFDEGAGASSSTHIWFNEPDTASASAQAKPVSSGWGYSSRSYALLSRIVADAVGGGPQALRDFAERELFTPLGMHKVTLELDQSDNLMGAHAIFATPRDWARLGQLYLQDGRVGETRILPQGWVKYSTTPTLDTGYGAGFWLNNTHTEMPEWGQPWGLPDAPADAFMARGYLGQYIVVVPSGDLVIMRAGASNARNSDVKGVGRLVRDVLSAVSAVPAHAAVRCE